jgi:AcrR family transcriptional regulator
LLYSTVRQSKRVGQEFVLHVRKIGRVKRAYRLSARVERQQATRRRIIAAAVELHSTVGPARTSISAVAERAGVSRPTIYAHFPDKPSLFEACSREAIAADPWPDPEAWRAIHEPVARLRHALAELYAHYRRNEALTANIVRDLDFLPEVPGRSMADTFRPMSKVLADGWQVAPDRRRLLHAAIDHALGFEPWQSLIHPHDLDDDQAIELMTALVLAAAGPLRQRRRAKPVG